MSFNKETIVEYVYYVVFVILFVLSFIFYKLDFIFYKLNFIFYKLDFISWSSKSFRKWLFIDVCFMLLSSL